MSQVSSSGWREQLAAAVAVFGHRNWIVVADAESDLRRAMAPGP
jgi:hypothetical protein